MSEIHANDAFWQSVINSIPDPVFVKDQEHRWIAFNDAFCSFMGRRREELIGNSDYDFFPKDEADEFWSVDEVVFKTEEENENEEFFTDADGETHFVATKKAVFRAPSGEKVLVGVIRNITARKRAQESLTELNRTLEQQVAQRTTDLEERAASLSKSEQAVREQSNVLESILNSLASGVLVVDSEARLVLQNPALERLVGNVPKDTSFFEWLASRVSGSARTIIANATSGDRVDVEEMLFSDERSMELRWLAMTSRPLIGDEVDAKGTVIVVRDVTARRKAEEELRAGEQRLLESQKMEAIGRLAGGVAHDFNNLLLVIQGCSTIIERALSEDSPLLPDVRQIGSSVERAAGLTRQLLAFGKRQVVNPRLLNLGEVVLGMEDMLSRLIGEGIKIRFRVDRELPMTHADRGQMEQVLMNLVINARDAQPSGGDVEVEVETVELEGRGGFVMLSVADSGEGMDEGTRLRVFEPFFTTKTGVGNTGLGLATVYGIVRQAGGEVAVESRPGNGSVFRVALPVVEGGLEPGAGTPMEIRGEEDLTGSECILLVEDDDSIRDLIARVLREYGYTVLPCRNGEEALASSRNHEGAIDLLLADVIMPGLTGPKVAAVLESERPCIRSLFMSGYSYRELDRHLESGRELDFIQKPFALTILIREIRAILERSHREIEKSA